MAQTTYHITLSIDGAHSVSVSSDDPTAMSEALAWAKGIYLKLLVQAPGPTEQIEDETDGGQPVLFPETEARARKSIRSASRKRRRPSSSGR